MSYDKESNLGDNISRDQTFKSFNVDDDDENLSNFAMKDDDNA